MSPDQNNTNAVWRDSNALGWDDAGEDESLQPYDQDEVEAMFDTPTAIPDDELDRIVRPSATRFEFLQQLGLQLSPILAPLLFGGITFLIVLPLIPKASFSPGYLAAIGLGFFAIAVLQCMMLYYAGSNNVYWTLSIIGGFFLFLLAGCFAVFGPIPTLVFFIVFLILSAIIARLYMRPIAEGSVDIIYSFGKYRRTLFPGLNFLFPWEWVDAHLYTRERQWTCSEQQVAISRDEDVHLKAMISYQLIPEDAYVATSQVENWEESLHALFEIMLQTVSNQLTPDDFITWQQSLHSKQGISAQKHADMTEESRWERINTILFQRMRDKVAPWGVLVNWVHIRDITVTPRGSGQDITGQMSGFHPPTNPVAAPPLQTQQPPTKVASNINPAGATSTTIKMPNPIMPSPTMGGMPNPTVQQPTVGKLPKESVLINAYEQIKAGKITSPDIIRRTAGDFQRFASDPEASRTASFDAARAAEVLFARASMYEEQANVEQQFSGGFPYAEVDQYDDSMPATSNWAFRPPTDDNLMAGG